jgi:hypothetical protein
MFLDWQWLVNNCSREPLMQVKMMLQVAYLCRIALFTICKMLKGAHLAAIVLNDKIFIIFAVFKCLTGKLLMADHPGHHL